MTHPDALAALAALRSARQAWPWLADLVAAGPTDRRRGGHITPAAAARRDQLLREERADLVGQQRSGLRPVGASPVPIDLDVVDAQEAALALAVDEAWRVSSTLRRRRTFVAGAAGTLGPGLVYGQPWIEAYGTTWEATTRYLLVALNHVTPPIAGHVARAASVIDREIRRAAGVGPAWRVVYAACPACKTWRLRAEVSDPDPGAWVVQCPECRCRGMLCDCGQPHREQRWGQRHWWSGLDWATHHGPLAGAIQRGNTGVWRPDGWYGRPEDIAAELGVTVRRVRDWIARSGDPDDRLTGMIHTVSDGRVMLARLDDCAQVRSLVQTSPQGRRPMEGSAA